MHEYIQTSKKALQLNPVKLFYFQMWITRWKKWITTLFIPILT